MRKLSWLLLVLIFFQVTSVVAQKSTIYTHDSKDFDKALALFNDAQYTSSQIIFEKVKSVTTNDRSNRSENRRHRLVITSRPPGASKPNTKAVASVGRFSDCNTESTTRCHRNSERLLLSSQWFERPCLCEPVTLQCEVSSLILSIQNVAFLVTEHGFSKLLHFWISGFFNLLLLKSSVIVFSTLKCGG